MFKPEFKSEITYQVCYTRYTVSFYLWRIRPVLNHYDQDCSSRKLKKYNQKYIVKVVKGRKEVKCAGLNYMQTKE